MFELNFSGLGNVLDLFSSKRASTLPERWYSEICWFVYKSIVNNYSQTLAVFPHNSKCCCHYYGIKKNTLHNETSFLNHFMNHLTMTKHHYHFHIFILSLKLAMPEDRVSCCGQNIIMHNAWTPYRQSLMWDTEKDLRSYTEAFCSFVWALCFELCCYDRFKDSLLAGNATICQQKYVCVCFFYTIYIWISPPWERSAVSRDLLLEKGMLQLGPHTSWPRPSGRGGQRLSTLLPQASACSPSLAGGMVGGGVVVGGVVGGCVGAGTDKKKERK